MTATDADPTGQSAISARRSMRECASIGRRGRHERARARHHRVRSTPATDRSAGRRRWAGGRDPLLDIALGPALLQRVAADRRPGDAPAVPAPPTLAFSGRDCATPGIAAAAAAARAGRVRPGPPRARAAGRPPITAVRCASTMSVRDPDGHREHPARFAAVRRTAGRGPADARGRRPRSGRSRGSTAPANSASTTGTATNWSAPRNGWSAAAGCSAPSSWSPTRSRSGRC